MLRIIGVLVLLAGAALVAFGIWAFATVGDDAARWASRAAASGVAFDSADWSHHWLSYTTLVATIGVTTTLAGAAMFAKRRWGLLLASGAAAFAAVGPWLYQMLGLASYGYEQSDSSGWTVTLLAVATAFLLWHFISRRRSHGGT
jgi:hypothetical protein